MNKRLKKVVAAVVLMGAIAMVQGCGGNREEAKAGNSGRVLTVATEAAYPPFRYVDKDKHLVGFEIDLAKEIGRRIDAEIEIKDMPFDKLLDAVAGKQVDMAIGAITVTEEREKKVAFSDSYYRLSGYSLIVKKGNPPVRNEEELAGRVVAAKRGSTSEARAKTRQPQEIISMDHYADIFRSVERGEVDVGITGDQAAIYELEHGGSSRLTLSGTIPTEDNFAITLSKDNPQLKKEINEALKSIMDDGTYDNLTHKWFLSKRLTKNESIGMPIKKGGCEEMTQMPPCPTVISTGAKRSGEISLPNGTSTVAGDLSTQSLYSAWKPFPC